MDSFLYIQQGNTIVHIYRTKYTKDDQLSTAACENDGYCDGVFTSELRMFAGVPPVPTDGCNSGADPDGNDPDPFCGAQNYNAMRVDAASNITGDTVINGCTDTCIEPILMKDITCDERGRLDVLVVFSPNSVDTDNSIYTQIQVWVNGVEITKQKIEALNGGGMG